MIDLATKEAPDAGRVTWLTVKEAAARLRVSADVLFAHIRAGRLRASNVGGGAKRPSYRIREDVLDSFMDSRTTQVATLKKRPRKRMKVTEFFPA